MGAKAMEYLWGILLVNIVGAMAVSWRLLFQTQETGVPHAEALVPVLWALIGGLAILITVMLRLWYKDFSDWKNSITLSINEIKAEAAAFLEAKQDLQDRLERIERLFDNRHAPGNTRQPKTKKGK